VGNLIIIYLGSHDSSIRCTLSRAQRTERPEAARSFDALCDTSRKSVTRRESFRTGRVTAMVGEEVTGDRGADG
jgi:hypothetical protein